MSLAEIGASVALRSKVVKPDKCPNPGTVCPSSDSTSVVLLAPDNPLQVEISLSTPVECPECSDIIIDASLCSGDAGRDWNFLEWKVTITEGGYEEEGNFIGRRDTEKLQALNDYLNQNYTSTKKLVTLPNDYLIAPATYNIQLKLENFLGETDTKNAVVEKTKKKKQPIVSIKGPKIVKKMRSDTILLFAAAGIPQCDAEVVVDDGDEEPTVRDKLLYSWKVFLGSKYLSPLDYPELVSVSRDQRFFKLASYILDANTVYTVEVTVTVDEPDGNKAKYMVNLEIGQQGVVASILGGAVRSGSHNNDVFFV